MAINGVDLIEAITEVLETQDGGFEPDAGAINGQIDAVIAYCKNWATAEGVSYDLAFAKMRATLVGVFNDVADRLVYGKHVKSACKAIFALAQTESEKILTEKAKKLGVKFAEFFCKQAREFNLKEEAKAEKARKKAERDAEKKEKLLKEKAEKKYKKLHARAVKVFKAFAEEQKLHESNKLDIRRKLPARVQAYLAQIIHRSHSGSFVNLSSHLFLGFACNTCKYVAVKKFLAADEFKRNLARNLMPSPNTRVHIQHISNAPITHKPILRKPR